MDDLTPEQWLQGLRAIRANYEAQYVQTVVDREVIASAGGLEPPVLKAVLEDKDKGIQILKARLDEIDERLAGASNGAAGLNRAGRRRLVREKAVEPMDA